jgi:Ni,Fe-hydrogenase III small subunit
MIPILLKVLRTGLVSERAPAAREDWRTRAPEIQAEILAMLGRALVIRHVDAGSCNACELELHALNNPYYNIEGLGIRFAASPRHADMLLVTGPVARNMEQALRIAYEAMPEPKVVVAVGDCGRDGGIFGESYATVGGASRVIPVDVVVPGCPPAPLAVLQGILTAVSMGALAPAGAAGPSASARR